MRWPRWRPDAASPAGHASALIGLAGATAILLVSVHRHYPVQYWLFWRYAGYWLAAGMWSAACLCAGHFSLRFILGRSLPLSEQIAVGFALGVFEFELLVFLTGLARLYGPLLFVVLPGSMLAAFGRPLLRDLRRAGRHLRARGVFRRNLTVIGWLAVGFGALYLVALYLQIMVPDNASYDARWRHMMVAEQYAVHGGLRRFAEGWVFGGSPQFTALLYTWGFMLPGAIFDRVELCAHIEYAIFLWTTLTGIPVMVRRLVPRANPAVVWSARFLFPGVLLYDSNLSVGADHIGAVFAAPLFLLSLRAWRSMDTRTCALLGVFVAAAVCAKETTALLLACGPVLTVAARFAIDALGLARGRAGCAARMRAAVVAGVTTIVFTTPHWLKNVVWYGNPVYPNLHRVFGGRPWDSDMGYVFQWAFLDVLWTPARNLDGLRRALANLVAFSFEPHAWWSMHRNVPVFGSLFTLLLLVLPVLRGTRRIWLLVAWVHLAIFVWFWVHHEERHLQALVPFMAAVVAALLVLLWRTRSAWLRAAACVLVGLQVVWGGDVYFYPSHSMIGTTPIKATADLLAAGFERKYRERLAFLTEQSALGAVAPRNAVLLVHERRDHLGLGRTALTDFYADQYGINYVRLGSPDRVHARLRELGVTHVVWDGSSRGYQPLAGDIVFYEFASRHTEQQVLVEDSYVGVMPARPPAPPPAGRLVAVLGCGREYATGLYELADLGVPRFGPRKKRFPPPRAALTANENWPENVFAIAVDMKCKERLSGKTRRQFKRVAVRNSEWGRPHAIWLRRR